MKPVLNFTVVIQYREMYKIVLLLVLGAASVASQGHEGEYNSYNQLPSWMQGIFYTHNDLLQNTALLSGGMSSHRQQTTWINTHNFLSNNKDIDLTIRQFMTLNAIRGVGSVEFNSGRLVKGCCSQLSFYSAVNSLVNINGVRKYLVHFEREFKYQYIPFSICIEKSAYVKHGHCFQGTTVMNLLAYRSGQSPPVSFDQFEVPTYCGCVQY